MKGQPYLTIRHTQMSHQDIANDVGKKLQEMIKKKSTPINMAEFLI